MGQSESAYARTEGALYARYDIKTGSKKAKSAAENKYLLDQRAVVDVEGGKLLNEDNDLRSSKGLEWDTVFIVKANDAEIPLLHEFNGAMNESGTTLEEERRLLYVAMTRARRKLYILYVIMDSNWQAELTIDDLPVNAEGLSKKNMAVPTVDSRHESLPGADCSILKTDCIVPIDTLEVADANTGNIFLKSKVWKWLVISSYFSTEWQWAKKQAFHDPKRLLDKVGFVVDERLRLKASKNKVVRWEQMPADKRAHLTREKQEYFQKKRIEDSMGSSAATSKQGHMQEWQSCILHQLHPWLIWPVTAHQNVDNLLMQWSIEIFTEFEKLAFFPRLMQIAYLQNLGCTIVPTSRLHASRLIEEYKSL
ncbi:hypothetical protein ACLOJK_030472 [Asimina triloba]